MWVNLQDAKFPPNYQWTSDDAEALLWALTDGGGIVSFGGLLVRIRVGDARIDELFKGPFGLVYHRLMVRLHNAGRPSRYPYPRG